ncbi:hypothetical protein GCM10010313_25840 [Streptomyces violarus]|nr:hypothetical protein [Streptomyces sp. CGMCC 4.1772]WRU03350.1 hypothetical protein VJ737_39200 [Streptomyces sp. CGMCC 4.1772]GHD07061.1 hypothetical protein GCM10010313_25840 [Streptomyces violarus]
MKGITFPAWQGLHYVTLAELLVRLGSFGLGLRWRVEYDEKWDVTAELESRSLIEMCALSATRGSDEDVGPDGERECTGAAQCRSEPNSPSTIRRSTASS